MRLCFASGNVNKVQEIQALLGQEFTLVGLKDIGCTEDLREDQSTLEGNSMQKAEFVFQTFHIPCFADDTGLEVAALNGAPGVYSARYAGEQRNADDNMNLLLSTLAGKEDRRARFRTVITLLAEGVVKQFEGEVSGTILSEKRGDKGFGYDPVFLPDGHVKTLAEMSMEEKNAISHRARAFKKLVDFLKQNRLQQA